jgi:hypothetical protein
VIGVPVHTPIAGVIVYLTVAGAPEVFVRVWEMVLPLAFENPEAVPLTNPAVHEYVTRVDGVISVDSTMLVADPLQMVCEAGVAVTFGLGLTVITISLLSPIQPPRSAGAVGVTV